MDLKVFRLEQIIQDKIQDCEKAIDQYAYSSEENEELKVKASHSAATKHVLEQILNQFAKEQGMC